MNKKINAKYAMSWYELDQVVYVNQKDYFYLNKEMNTFLNDQVIENDIEIIGIIRKIYHKELGKITGIITYGLDYKLILSDGKLVEVNAEENTGEIYNSNIKIKDWNFDIELDLLEVTGESSSSRIKKTNMKERKSIIEKRMKEIKDILGLDIKGNEYKLQE